MITLRIRSIPSRRSLCSPSTLMFISFQQTLIFRKIAGTWRHPDILYGRPIRPSKSGDEIKLMRRRVMKNWRRIIGNWEMYMKTWRGGDKKRSLIVSFELNLHCFSSIVTCVVETPPMENQNIFSECVFTPAQIDPLPYTKLIFATEMLRWRKDSDCHSRSFPGHIGQRVASSLATARPPRTTRDQVSLNTKKDLEISHPIKPKEQTQDAYTSKVTYDAIIKSSTKQVNGGQQPLRH